MSRFTRPNSLSFDILLVLFDLPRDFEKRYWGLTPAQYFSIGFFIRAAFLAVRGLTIHRTEPSANDP